MMKSKLQGRTVFLYFTLFFCMIVAVNGIFVYTALNTHTGTVTEHAYEKGLSYNNTLETYRNQPNLQQKAVLDNGTFRWIVRDENGSPVVNARAAATFFRPVSQGSDFDIILSEVSPGVYESNPDFPAKGIWTAQLDATWNNKQYRTAQTIIVK